MKRHRERLTPGAALAKLAATSGSTYVRVFERGSLEIEIYRPVNVDAQTPHTRDELYVVISGSGELVNGGARQPFEAGEVLFVAAGVEHRFENFTDDFATWVFFYGPPGGEASALPGSGGK